MKHQSESSRSHIWQSVAQPAFLLATIALLTAAAFHSAMAAPKVDERLIVPVIMSNEWGGSWHRVGNEVNEIDKFYSVARCDVYGEDDQVDSYMLAGSDLGIYSMTNPSTNWIPEQEGISASPTVVTFVPGRCTQAYATLLGRGVWRGDYSDSAPKGWTWVRVDKDAQLAAARSVAIVHVSGETFNIYVAGDFGVMWLAQLPTTPQTWQATNLTSQTTSLTTDGSMLASVWNNGIHTRVGNGVWSLLGAGSPADKLIYEAVFDGAVGVAGTQSGAFRWAGSDWQRVASIDQTTFSVALSDLGLFVGQRAAGVYVSSDGGVKWSPLNRGLLGIGGSTFQVRDLRVHPDNERTPSCLYAATTTGIWQWGDCP